MIHPDISLSMLVLTRSLKEQNMEYKDTIHVHQIRVTEQSRVNENGVWNFLTLRDNRNGTRELPSSKDNKNGAMGITDIDRQ